MIFFQTVIASAMLFSACSAAVGANVSAIALDIEKRKLEAVDLEQSSLQLTDKSTVSFKGIPRAARTAVALKFKNSDFNGFDYLTLRIKPDMGMRPKSLNLALRNGKRYYKLDNASLLPSDLSLKSGAWREIVYDLCNVPRDKTCELRVYLNYDKALTGKQVSGKIQLILDKKSRKIKSLPLGNIRKRVFPHPYLAARAHIKYALHINWFSDPDYYAERILMLDRSLEQGADKNDPYGVGGKANFVRTVELMKMSGADGIAMLNIDISNTYINRTLSGMKYADEMGLKAAVVPEISIFSEGTGEEYLDKQIKNLGTKFIGSDGLRDRLFPAAVASPSTFKYKGKTLISSYNACVLPPEFWGKYLAQCRARVGDKIIFIVELRKIFYSAVRRYHSNGGLSERELDEIRDYLNSYLRVCDGILFAGQNHIVEPPNTNHFYYQFYHDIFIPLINEVMNQPQNRGKLLGLGISKGYANHVAGQLQSEDGTRNLRSIIEYATKINPDYVVLVEWNEIKERTNLEPTIADGRCSMRILRYYFNKLKGLPNEPLPGDDINIPNMVLTYRPQVAPGEKLDFELLNIPDTVSIKDADYKVKLELENLDGKVVKSFSFRNLPGKNISETRFTAYADSQLAPQYILLPRLTVIDTAGKTKVYSKGFPYINISAVELRDGKYYKIPLRDLAEMRECEFSAKLKNGGAQVSASVKDGDKIAFLEVLRNRRPVFSAVEDPDYQLDGNKLLIKVSWNAWKEAHKDFPSITINAAGGKIHRVKASNRGWGRDFSPELADNGKVTVKLHKLTHGARRGIYLAVDKTAEEMTISSGKFSKTISLCQLEKNGFYRMLPGNGFNIMVENFHRIADLPPHLNKNTFVLSKLIPDISPRDILCMRYITESGRIYRTKPKVFADISKELEISAWNDRTNKPENIKVSAEAAMPVTYAFDPSCGAMLRTVGFDSRYDAQLGGSTNYGDPFFNRDNFPKGQTQLQPEWIKDAKGNNILKFNGKSNNLVVPLYAAPARAFTYELEIKPESKLPQMLLRSYSKTSGAVMIVLVDGKLKVRFSRHDMKNIDFITPEIIKSGKWQKVTIAFDMNKFRIKTGDGKIYEYPCVGIPLKMTQMVFGGVGNGGRIKYFKGYLRYLKIYPYSIL